MPHVHSIKGVATRYTPFWAHKLVWRHFLHANPQHEPFPTVMSPDIAPECLAAFARERGLTIEFLAEFEGWEQKSIRWRIGVRGRAFRFVRRAVQLASLGAVTAEFTDVIVVIAKQ